MIEHGTISIVAIGATLLDNDRSLGNTGDNNTGDDHPLDLQEERGPCGCILRRELPDDNE